MNTEVAIARQVHAALESEPPVNVQRYPLSVRIDAGALVPEGEVGSIAAKKFARRCAGAVDEIRGVVDRLRVAAAVRRADGEILDAKAQ